MTCTGYNVALQKYFKLTNISQKQFVFGSIHQLLTKYFVEKDTKDQNNLKFKQIFGAYHLRLKFFSLSIVSKQFCMQFYSKVNMRSLILPFGVDNFFLDSLLTLKFYCLAKFICCSFYQLII